MKIILLAAGTGTRLYPLTKDTPKVLIDLGGGCTLLDRQVHMLTQSGVIREIVYVVGYLAAKVEEAVEALDRRARLCVRTTYNPFFGCSNNLVSLWLARHELDQEVMICNGDNLFHSDVYRGLASVQGEGIYLTISRKAEYQEDDMKVCLDSQGLVQAVSKELDPRTAHAQSVGLAMIRGTAWCEVARNCMDWLVHHETYRNAFWLEIFNHLGARGVPIRTFEIDGASQWQEVDLHLDVTAARATLSRWANRFGGQMSQTTQSADAIDG